MALARLVPSLLPLLLAAAPAQGHRLMRYADVHGDRIVFTYEDDLWLVPAAGGRARRITNHPGVEAWARFSPDGKWLAFTGQYDGGADVYVMPAEGGVPRRLTYHPEADLVLDWWPDGQWVLFRANREFPFRGEELYRVALEGGLPERLPVDRAGLAAVSPDGKSIAYNRITRENRTWKRHRGGTAQDIWLGSLAARDYRKVVDTDWTDNFPMWQDGALCFTSDREHGTLNLYRLDLEGGAVTALTAFQDYDVKYPAIGPGQIVFQHAETLHLLDLATGRVRPVPVEIPTDAWRLRPEPVAAAPAAGSFGLSPTGARLLLEARGEILHLPAAGGAHVDVTRSSASREKGAAWSPDGRWIAFLSDRTGEEEVWLADPEGRELRQLTKNGKGWRGRLHWSPDGRRLAFADKFLRLNLADAATGEILVADQADYDDAWERWGVQEPAWSPDGLWLAYTKLDRSLNTAVFLYSVEEKKVHRVTDGLTMDSSPSFDPEGRFLCYLSQREFRPVMGQVDQNHVFLRMTRPVLALLRAGDASPFLPPEDREPVKGEEAEPPPAKAPFRIDPEGIGRRLVAVPGLPAGDYFRLEAVKGGFLMLRREEPVFSKYDIVDDHTAESLTLLHYDLKGRRAVEVQPGVANYHLAADRAKLVYRSGTNYGVLAVGAKGGPGAGQVSLRGVDLWVDRAQEFAQIFHEAWRIQRDWFYDPGHHGVDWEAERERYARFLPYCGTRGDLNYLIGELIGELNAGHTYVSGGDPGARPRRVATGLLGADLAAEPGVPFYRISHIVPGTPGEPAEASPLDEPGSPVREGHYLIAIDGEELGAGDNPWRLLQGKAGAWVTLAYNDRPTAEGAKRHRVRTLASERAIRQREWVERNRAFVDQATGGEIGYLHLPDMMEGGLIEFARAWYPNFWKRAFVVDARYNGGGFTADMILDRLERRLWAMTQPREGKALRDPERAFHGPWVVLVNEDTGSNGEFFAEAVKVKGMARLIGMRTWGGSVGIEPHQDLVDGGAVTPPQFGLYGLDGRWLIEGRGVEPDQEVQNLPGDVLRGRDAQLEAALEYLRGELPKWPAGEPAPPAYPDKSKPKGS